MVTREYYDYVPALFSCKYCRLEGTLAHNDCLVLCNTTSFYIRKKLIFSMFLKNLPTTYLPSICLNIEFSCLRNNAGRTTHRLIFLDKVFLHILPFVMIFQCNVP